MYVYWLTCIYWFSFQTHPNLRNDFRSWIWRFFWTLLRNLLFWNTVLIKTNLPIRFCPSWWIKYGLIWFYRKLSTFYRINSRNILHIRFSPSPNRCHRICFSHLGLFRALFRWFSNRYQLSRINLFFRLFRISFSFYPNICHNLFRNLRLYNVCYWRICYNLGS